VNTVNRANFDGKFLLRILNVLYYPMRALFEAICSKY
jgi:hypothetical protein